MRFVPTKSVEQLDFQALHRVRARLVRLRTAVINQIRAFLLERGIAVRQGHRFLRAALPDILAQATDLLSPRMIQVIADLSADWRHLDDRVEEVSGEIEALAKADQACRRPSPVLARSSPVPWWPRTVIAPRLPRGAFLPPGSGSYPDRHRPVIGRSSGASRNAATST